MELNLEPVKVSIEIETPSLAREAFYNICFITENEKATRTLKVERLRDLLDNGYDRSSLAYNFCVGVFAQQGIPTVYVRAKRAVESYSDAFSADDNSNYYFVVIESKELYEVSEFNEYLIGKDEFKLQFYSNNSKDLFEVRSGKLVNYYQDVFDFSEEEDYYLKKAYKVVTTHNYASKPYPTLVEKEDAYQTTVRPFDFTLREVLKERFFDGDGYNVTAVPLDFTLRDLLRKTYVDAHDTYTTSVAPLDFTLRDLLRKSYQDNKEAFTTSANPLDFTLKRVLIEYKQPTDRDVFTVSAEPLDFTMKLGV